MLAPPVPDGATADGTPEALLSPGADRLDAIDAELLDLLVVDGRMTNRELADATGVSAATAGARIRRMVSERVLVFTALFDWEQAGFGWFVIVTVNVEARAVREVAVDLGALPGCVGVATVLGDADLVCYFLVADRSELHRFATCDLGGVQGIGSIRVDMATRTEVTALGRRFFLARKVSPIRLPHPVIELDDLDSRIIVELLSDGRRSNRSIARTIGVSEGAVRMRLQRMTTSGLFQVQAMIEPLALGMVGVVATIGLVVDRDRIVAVAEQAAEIPGVLFVAIVVGNVDVSISIGAHDQRELLDVIRHRIRTLRGVRSIDTLQMVEIVKFTPYLKRIGC
ncbi:Lrp/AsnC family transcriptional regulator [Nocardia sp. NPDC055029]